jgi:aminomethyltransferase
VNAANIEKDWRWIARWCPEDVTLRNRSDEIALLALQGPNSGGVLAKAGAPGAGELRRWRFARFALAGVEALVSRTGYTGADGFEIYLDAAGAETVFGALLDAGSGLGLRPAGLGARDTLRLEAALPLYGHELDDETSPLEAGLARFVDLDGRNFLGEAAILRRRAAGHTRALVGFEIEGRGIARAGYDVAVDGQPVGRVTSGAPSPTLGRSIGLAYVPPSLAAPGSRFDVLIRGQAAPARVVGTPFVRAGGPRGPGEETH